MKFCYNCGSQLGSDELFCPKCGAKQQESVQNNSSEFQQPQPVKIEKEVQERLQQPQESVNTLSNKVEQQEKSNIIYLLLLVSIVIVGVSCFLPLVSILGYSMNFVYYNGKVLDGTIIVALEVVALICLLFKKRIPVFVFQVISVILAIYDFINIFKISLVSSILGIGFYLLVISLIAAFVLSLIRIIKKDKYM